MNLRSCQDNPSDITPPTKQEGRSLSCSKLLIGSNKIKKVEEMKVFCLT